MPFYDHDLHIHSYLSPCAGDTEQTAARILRYAEENRLNTICLTDHFWDENETPAFDTKTMDPALFSFRRLSTIKPLPQTENVRFLFGCECEIRCDGSLSISRERFDEFDFIVIPTTHFHNGYVLLPEEAKDSKTRAVAWVRKFEYILEQDLPFHKIGLAHLTSCGLAPTREQLFDVVSGIPDKEMERLFKRTAALGMGVELNVDGMAYDGADAEMMFRPFFIAKECGCKFYCGSDAHQPAGLDRAKAILEHGTSLLKLTENDKFDFHGLGTRK